jgi:glutathione peroxidase
MQRRSVLRLAGALGAACAGAAPSVQATTSCPPLLQHRVPRLQDEKMQDLCQYRGQVLLVVNTASYCGFTGQYRALETLYDRYRARGFSVLGFPSNDFSQEPGSNAQIAEFCESTFGVRFPMFIKTRVGGQGQGAVHPLFESLATASGQRPQWNFHKYLVGRDGRAVSSFASRVDPLDARLVRELERLLIAKVD